MPEIDIKDGLDEKEYGAYRFKGKPLSESIAAYRETWRHSGSFRRFLLLNLWMDLGLPPWKLLKLRCDFLSAAESRTDSDGLWLVIEEAIKLDPKIGEKYQPFWERIFPPVKYRNMRWFVHGNTKRLNRVLYRALVLAKPLP